MKTIAMISGVAALAVLGACTATGNTERGALGGAALGALAGAAIGNNVGSGDASTGAAIGALAGGVGGAAYGAQKDRADRNEGGSGQYATGPNGEPLMYDSRAQRYYYVERRSGRSYWANGDYRG